MRRVRKIGVLAALLIAVIALHDFASRSRRRREHRRSTSSAFSNTKTLLGPGVLHGLEPATTHELLDSFDFGRAIEGWVIHAPPVTAHVGRVVLEEKATCARRHLFCVEISACENQRPQFRYEQLVVRVETLK